CSTEPDTSKVGSEAQGKRATHVNQLHASKTLYIDQLNKKLLYLFKSIYDWYHPDQTEESAKAFLKEYPYEPMDNGSLFLVHPYGKYREDIRYVISCKWKMEIYQYRVRYKEDEDVYTVRSAKASSLLDLVEQYRLTAVGKDGIRSIYSKETALSHLLYPIPWPRKYKDRCYHGLLGRTDAERVLMEGFKKRSTYSPFLIRDSNSEPGTLIISSMFVKKSDSTNRFEHRLVEFKNNLFEALECKEPNLMALAKSIEEKYRNHGDLMDLKVLNREGYNGVDTDVLEHHLPPSIKTMDETAIKIFREALEEGFENYHHVRVMVVGHHGAGKSSLTRRLLRESMEEVQSTDGVEIYTKRGRFQLSDHKWIKSDDKQENENEKLERIARYLTQRFPQGIPTYLSIRDFKKMETEEEKTSNYSNGSNLGGKPPAPSRSTFIEKDARTQPMNIQNKSGRSYDYPPNSQRTSVPHRNPSLKSLRGEPSKRTGDYLTPTSSPKSYPDPRVSVRRRKSSSSDSDDDDASDENDDRNYSNNFTRVLLDLKNKFVKSNENSNAIPVSPDDINDSDYVGNENDNTEKRSSSFDFDLVGNEQALKQDLEEVLRMSSKFLKNETGSITFWDFAGQTVFQTTHQAFMSSKAVYLLVTDVSLPIDHVITDDDDGQNTSGHKSVGEFLKFWLNTIHTYCHESQRGSPKVLVVSTHKDKTTNTQKEIEEHHREIKRVVKKKMLSPHLVPEMFCVDCNDTDEETFDKIRSKILEIAKDEDILTQKIPTSWIYLERKIMDLRKEGKKVLNFKEVKQLNRFCTLNLKDEKAIKVFLQFHHAIGNMLYYDEKGLDDIIILNPQWLVDAFKCFITSEKFLGLSPSESLLEEMKKTGHLSMEIIETLWSEREDQSYLENKEHIIKILERMDIISRPKRYMKDGESSEEMTTFLVPCLMSLDLSPHEEMKKTGQMTNENIETVWIEREDKSYSGKNKEQVTKILERMDIISRHKRYMKDGESRQELAKFLVPSITDLDSPTVRAKWLKSTNNIPALGFYFKDEFMPPAVFYRLLAACMAKFPAVEQNDVPLVFANTAVFRLDKLNFLLLAHDDFLIRAWVLRFSNTPFKKSSIHYTIKKFLEESLTIILEIYTSCSACPEHKLTKRCEDCRKCNANFPFRVVVQCSQCISSDTTFKGLHLWGDLESNESVVCADHDNVHVIESDDMLACWECPNTIHADNLTLSIKRSVSVLEMPIKMPYKTLGRLARRVSGYWEEIAYNLDLGDNFVETTKRNFPHLASDQCFHVLRTWYDTSPKEKRILRTLDDVFAKVDIDRETLQTLEAEELEWENNKYLDKQVSNRGIDIICNRLGKKSYQLAIELGLTPEETERIQMDFRTSIAQSREYINRWRQKAENPTYKVLLQALARVDVANYRDVLTHIY
ncbi:uncharacterized protein LOC134249530, partial [Saccostrea cucullata]|uniref:uncharacterized protein LOC134249530 n=1 Tax=Saccostrea cuccullata TaxID=36930 RepID=UPI002ED1D093